MQPNLLFILLLSWISNSAFSQADLTKQKASNDSIKVPAAVFKKIDLPLNQKVSPEIFYIINDKPVSREEYLKQQKKKQ
jgi:hypothetical protein